ncbi:MAG: hypothetical protein VX209_04630 [Thermoproteota archaeon]|nr:hypothetical protein [Thermoproteota archaeon]
MTKTIDYSEQIKEILYETIAEVTEEKLHSMLNNQNYQILNDVIFPSLEKIKKLNENLVENLGIFATSIMHYILTNMMIPSQRNIIEKNIEIDIIIPRIKEIQDGLIISFAKTDDISEINNMVNELVKIQPDRNNIWVVATKKLDKITTYIINEYENEIPKLISDLKEFVDSKNYGKLKISR